LSNVFSLDAKRQEKEEQLQPGECMWGPQHAGVVKKHEPEDLQEEE
jgi:hypothetical protein